MIDFLCKSYERFIDGIVTLLLAITTIIGFILFGKVFGGRGFSLGYALLGAIVGFLSCFILEMFTLPPIMILFNIDSKLGELKSNTFSDKEITSVLQKIYNTMENINLNIEKVNQDVKKGNSESSAENANLISTIGKVTGEDDLYSVAYVNGRTFAMKEGKYYCPKCHTRVDSETSSCCSNCGESFTK